MVVNSLSPCCPPPDATCLPDSRGNWHDCASCGPLSSGCILRIKQHNCYIIFLVSNETLSNWPFGCVLAGSHSKLPKKMLKDLGIAYRRSAVVVSPDLAKSPSGPNSQPRAKTVGSNSGSHSTIDFISVTQLRCCFWRLAFRILWHRCHAR